MSGGQPAYRDRHFLIEDRQLSYPTYFRDGSSAMGIFCVNAAAADSIIAGTGLRTARIAPGKAALSLICVNYTDTDCGHYQEIALAFFVERYGKQARRTLPYLNTWWDILRGKVASYTWCLPVSSTLSRDCGRYMWGFPKSLERIEYQRANGRAGSRWMIDDELVLAFSVPDRGSETAAEISPPVYSILDGRPHVSYLTQRYSGVGHHGRDGQLQLGSHPAADSLRQLGLPKKPLIASYNGRLEFEMSHPEPL